jgi:hypothetical protein
VTRVVLAALVTIACLARGAHAQVGGFLDKDVAKLEIDSCSPDKDASTDELRKRGAEHYSRGEVLYLQGDYKGAVLELVASYCEIPYYSILKDIGQAYERQLEYAKAIAYLERYVLDVPKDAQRANACSPDPQDDKQNVLARIHVLEGLTAKIRVQTVPPDARVSIVQNNVVVSAGTSGSELEVVGGPYQLVVERAGYKTTTVDLHAEIGKPYTFLEQLQPLEGRLRIRVTPGDARVFLDQREVGAGFYAATLPAGKYTVQAEAADRVTETRTITVLSEQDTDVSFELAHVPEFGRRQLMIYGGIAGTVAGALIASAQSSRTIEAAGGAAGLSAGLLAVYWGTPHDLALGTSSLTVTSSLIGGVGGAALAAVLTNNLLGRNETSDPLIGGGLLVGAGVGYYIGDQTHPTPGDAAVINSGALWGTVAGGLFAVTFDAGSQINGGLVLTGLAMGTAGGTLLQRYFTVSRTRAALIDVSGIVGIVLALAAESLVQRARNDDSQSDARTANYALGGMATGLIVGGILTRNLDDPKLPGSLAPSIGKATTAAGSMTTTLGVSGRF